MTDSTEHIGVCKLCGQRTKLCHSHIVPEFCFKPLYETRKTARHALEINLRVDGTRNIRTIQKGLREYMLCASCEGCISKYELQFKNYWYDDPGLPQKMDLRYEGIQMAGADYASTKLFHLSVLWRAGMARRFRNVSLGPYYSKTIGQMLLNSDPGSPESFPVFGTVLIDRDGTVNHGIITEPVRSRFEHSRVYFMCYAGCEWNFTVTDHPTKAQAEVARAIDASGNIWLPYCIWSKSNSVTIAKKYIKRK